MSDAKPEALRLAEILDEDYDEGDLIVRDAADELRRLHAMCEEMYVGLNNTLSLAQWKWGNLDPDANAVFDMARATLVKWKESQ